MIDYTYDITTGELVLAVDGSDRLTLAMLRADALQLSAIHAPDTVTLQYSAAAHGGLALEVQSRWVDVLDREVMVKPAGDALAEAAREAQLQETLAAIRRLAARGYWGAAPAEGA